MTGIEEVAAIAAIAGTAVSVGATIYSATQQYSGGQQAQQASEFNAATTESAASSDISQADQDMRRKIAQEQAAYGASGVTAEGTPLLVMSDQASQGELNKRLIQYRADVASTQKLQAGQVAATQGTAQAGASILTGATKLYDATKPLLQSSKTPTSTEQNPFGGSGSGTTPTFGSGE
jgi:hypothetical protein